MDFDGTLADIVPHPDDARPRAEVVPLLHALVRPYGRVGIVSGRPVEFLRAHLPVPGLALVGQYGLERSVGDRIEADPRVEPFLAAVAEVSARAAAELPGVLIERKGGIAVTLHWRTEQAQAEAGRAWADRIAAETGLALYPTRMAVELRPPVGVDKGDAVTALAGDSRIAMFAGDDHGDLAAFDALAALARRRELDAVVRVAVRSPEEPAELVARTDVGVAGPAGFVSLLVALGRAGAAGRDRPTADRSRHVAGRAGSARATRSSSHRSAGWASAAVRRPIARAVRSSGVHRERGVERVRGLGHVERMDLHRVVAEQLEGAGLARQAEHGVALAQQRPLHRDEVEAVAHRVHEQDVGALQRRDRAREVVLRVDDHRLPVARVPSGR